VAQVLGTTAREHLAGDDVAGDQVVALPDEPRQELDRRWIAVRVVDEERRIQQVAH
jgi:hypothetical protein